MAHRVFPWRKPPCADLRCDIRGESLLTSRSLSESAVELFPDTFFERLPLASLYGRSAPLEVDLGCGDGGFLTVQAAKNPDRDFLGIERLLGRVQRSCRKAERLGLKNLRILRVESLYAVQHLLPAGSVHVFHIAFPDPWPKRRHQNRRLLNPPFFDAMRAALAEDGEMRFTTDDSPYYDFTKALCSARSDFASVPWMPADDYPRTAFERLFLNQGKTIHRLKLRKL